MTAPQIVLRDALLARFAADGTLPELHDVAAPGQPRSLFDTTPDPGLSPPVVAFFGDLVREYVEGATFAAGSTGNEQLLVDVWVSVQAEPDGDAGEASAAQAASADLAHRIATSVRSATPPERTGWVPGYQSRWTRVTRTRTDPPVLLEDGLAECVSQISVVHDHRSR